MKDTGLREIRMGMLYIQERIREKENEIKPLRALSIRVKSQRLAGHSARKLHVKNMITSYPEIMSKIGWTESDIDA